MAKSVIEPLMREHAKGRTLAGELKAFTESFDVPGMKQATQALLDLLEKHTLKEEAGLYLIGMKSLKADNKKLPDLFKEHDHTVSRLHRLNNLLYSARLTNIEDQARQLVFVILEGLDHHMQEEESVVWPALEKLLSDEHKELILKRYMALDSSPFDEYDRIPLLSLPDHPGMSDDSI